MRPKEKQDLFTYYAGKQNQKITYEEVIVWYFLVYDKKPMNRRSYSGPHSMNENVRYKPAVYTQRKVALQKAQEARDAGFNVNVYELPSEEILYNGRKLLNC